MSLSIGIVGLPNVGKSTLFNALTKNQVLAANYPFATIEPNVGIVGVPDERLAKLAKISGSEQIIPATVKFIDIAGLVKGAATGAGLGNKFLSHIREVGAIAQVVRAFEDNNVTHVEDRIHPKDDIEIINDELCLADLKTVENKLDKLNIEQKSNPKIKDEIDLYIKLKRVLDQGQLISQNLLELPDSTEELNLLTKKQFLYIFNVSEEDLNNETKKNDLEKLVYPYPTIILSAKLESELIDLDESEKEQLLSDYQQKESGLKQLIKKGYKSLGLQTFYTSGEKETKAWVIQSGFSAPQAAGVIHTDFEKGFIKAEIVKADDFIKSGGWNEARAKGKVRLEGKDYIMQEDDIAIFRFNN